MDVNPVMQQRDVFHFRPGDDIIQEQDPPKMGSKIRAFFLGF